LTAQESAKFLFSLSIWRIACDATSPAVFLREVRGFIQTYGLATYDATYLELAQRRSAEVAIFDRPLAAGPIAAGVCVYGDTA